MRCFVTGASGFIGSHIVREWLARGHQVKGLVRPGADVRGLVGLEFERVTGDILDPQLMKRELIGCDWCFHVAASYRLWMRHYAPNWTLQETFAALEKITGVPAPRHQVPYWLALMWAGISEAFARFTGKAPQATLAGVRMARHKMWFDPNKAVRELGLPQTPQEQAFADAVAWFRANGYVRP